jgi:L-rhamnose-H+ transport protein
MIAGAMNGSFAAPTKYMTKWEWENSWFVYAFTALIVMPFATVFLTVPDAGGIFHEVEAWILVQTFIFGAGWGIGGNLFGLGAYMLGLSMAYTIVVGIIAVVGALIPMLVQNPEKVLQPGGLVILSAMAVTVVGVAFCGIAGNMRDKAKQPLPEGGKKEHSFKAALVVCILAGIFSAMLNLGFCFGGSITEVASDHFSDGGSELITKFLAGNVIWLVALLGGFVPFLLHCGYLLTTRRTWNKYTAPGSGSHWFYGALMGILLTGSVMVYGVGADLLGELGPTVGWLAFMAFIVLTGNVWGIITGEWKGAPRAAKVRMIQGTVLLIGSVLLVGYGNYLVIQAEQAATQAS